MTSPLPVTLDSTYADSGTDPSVAAHQQHHDALHARYNIMLTGNPRPVNTQTSSYTLVLADAAALVRINTAAAAVVTVPTDAQVAFPVGTTLEVEQAGAGQVGVNATAGVTVLTPAGTQTRAQYSAIQLVKVAANTWRLGGDLAAGIVAGRSFYVAPTGNDTAAGAIGTPRQTISAGLALLTTAGDTLYLRAGTYTPASTVTITKTGTSTAPYTVRGYPGETAIVDGASVTAAATNGTTGDVVLVTGSAWVVVDGFTVRNGGTLASTSAASKGMHGVRTTNSTDVIVRNITTTNMSRGGVRLDAGTNRAEMYGCDSSGCAAGFVANGTNLLLHDNNAHDNTKQWDDANAGGGYGGQAFSIENTAGPVEVYNNVASGNRSTSTAFGMDGIFVELYYSQNVNIHHNKTTGGVQTLESSGSTAGCRFWRNEVISEDSFGAFHQADGLRIENNTIYNMGAYLTFDVSGTYGNGSTVGLVIRNNIFQSVSTNFLQFFYFHGGLDASAIINNNVYRVGAGGTAGGFAEVGASPSNVYYGTFAAWKTGTGKDANSVLGDPLFVSAPSNLTLQATSPAIDLGAVIAGVTDGYTGAAPDAGRWER